MKRFTEEEIRAKALELCNVSRKTTDCGPLDLVQFTKSTDGYRAEYFALAKHVLGIPEETEDEKAGRRAYDAYRQCRDLHDQWDRIDRGPWIAAAKAARSDS